MLEVARYRQELEGLGLTTMDGVKRCPGEPVARHGDRRDVLRLTTNGDRPMVFFLKRSWHTHLKDGLASLVRRGKVCSAARIEWENSQRIAQAGFPTAELVAYGEECGPLKAKFSFILTRAAAEPQTLLQFLQTCHDRRERCNVLSEIAARVRRMHEAGLFYPDLFSRHVFVDSKASPPSLSLIDVARLERHSGRADAMRARDLAALNASVPRRYASAAERLRFLRDYRAARRVDRKLIGLIERRMRRLLIRSKFRDFAAPAPAADGAAIG